MEILLGFLLFVGVIIMVTLIFIGYFLYANSKRTASINEMLTSKEYDLVELYDSLEQMMEELEKYTEKSKSEIQLEIEKIKKLSELKSLAMIKTEEAENKIREDVYKSKEIIKKEETTQKDVQLEDRLQIEREKLMKRSEKCFDLKGNKVRAFYNKGLPVADIAREMGIGQGEVQLILNLKNKII